jgi:hypothetical protein
MITEKLFLSFWHIDLGNLPEGHFRHWQVLPNDAKSYIHEAQLTDRLFCVSQDDLLAPFREREREKHQEFCAMLTEQFGIRLSLRDFCSEDKDESGPIYCTQPLQMAEIQNQNRLMVITCAYQLGEKTKKGRPLFSIAPSSVAFHLFESIQAENP